MTIDNDDCPECAGKGWIEWPSYGGMGEQYSYPCDDCDGTGKVKTDHQTEK